MQNKEKLLEGIKQSSNKISQLETELASTKEQLNALKSELDKPDTVEVAADGAILVEGKKGYFVRGDGRVDNSTFSIYNGDIKQLSTYATLQQAKDEVLRREISCYIRRRACELNDNHDWRKIYRQDQYSIFIRNNNIPVFDLNHNDAFSYITSYFNKKEHAQTVADELNAKYWPETLKKLYYTED